MSSESVVGPYRSVELMGTDVADDSVNLMSYDMINDQQRVMSMFHSRKCSLSAAFYPQVRALPF